MEAKIFVNKQNVKTIKLALSNSIEYMAINFELSKEQLERTMKLHQEAEQLFENLNFKY